MQLEAKQALNAWIEQKNRINDETLSDIQKFGQMSHPASNYEIEAARRKKSLVNFMEMAQLIIYGLA